MEPMVIMNTVLNLVTKAVLNVHWTSCNLSDILSLLKKKKGMCGQMSAEICNVEVHYHPSSGEKLSLGGGGG